MQFTDKKNWWPLPFSIIAGNGPTNPTTPNTIFQAHQQEPRLLGNYHSCKKKNNRGVQMSSNKKTISYRKSVNFRETCGVGVWGGLGAICFVNIKKE